MPVLTADLQKDQKQSQRRLSLLWILLRKKLPAQEHQGPQRDPHLPKDLPQHHGAQLEGGPQRPHRGPFRRPQGSQCHLSDKGPTLSHNRESLALFRLLIPVNGVCLLLC